MRPQYHPYIPAAAWAANPGCAPACAEAAAAKLICCDAAAAECRCSATVQSIDAAAACKISFGIMALTDLMCPVLLELTILNSPPTVVFPNVAVGAAGIKESWCAVVE